MKLQRSITLTTTAVLVASLTACAQFPGPGHAHGAGAGGPASHAGAGDHMARMDSQMTAMHELRDKLQRARTPEERNALMAEHWKLMEGGMAAMGGMGPGMMGRGPGGPGPMAGMAGAGGPPPADLAAR
ncbi:MAG: hypothetical protein Q8N44_06250, partial [Rubrivivax sp.]|nr:hypothetical protein [Rubrivivax sp.]